MYKQCSPLSRPYDPSSSFSSSADSAAPRRGAAALRALGGGDASGSDDSGLALSLSEQFRTKPEIANKLQSLHDEAKNIIEEHKLYQQQAAASEAADAPRKGRIRHRQLADVGAGEWWEWVLVSPDLLGSSAW